MIRLAARLSLLQRHPRAVFSPDVLGLRPDETTQLPMTKVDVEGDPWGAALLAALAANYPASETTLKLADAIGGPDGQAAKKVGFAPERKLE